MGFLLYDIKEKCVHDVSNSYFLYVIEFDRRNVTRVRKIQLCMSLWSIPIHHTSWTESFLCIRHENFIWWTWESEAWWWWRMVRTAISLMQQNLMNNVIWCPINVSQRKLLVESLKASYHLTILSKKTTMKYAFTHTTTC